MNNLIEKIKKEYNFYLKRNDNAEIYFKNKSIEECLKQMSLLNEITIKLSRLQNEYKKATGVEMSSKEKIKGFQ